MEVKFPLKELKDFHKTTRNQMKSLEKAIKQLERTKNLQEFEQSYVNFFNFCEKDLPIHVEDEEKALFPMMRTYFPEDGESPSGETSAVTIDDILNDHKDVFAAIEAIRLMKRMLGGEKNKDPKFIREIVARSKILLAAMEDHFIKEETMLFTVVEEGFSSGQMGQLARKMTKIRQCRKEYGDSVKSCKV